MGVIRVLPESVANKIAAGEVIERPASVVKELVENALDAGASLVDITVEMGGRGLIRVSDNGCGMLPEDARTALERHATSKITDLQDLARIGSFGFRGEALPSIAAVSRMRLITRSQSGPGGTELVVEGGALRASQEHPCAVGTTVEARDLFFNTPARRKFLKSDATEEGVLLETVTRLALPALKTRFVLRSNGKVVLDLMPADRLEVRAREIFGEDAARELLELRAEQGAVRINGLISKPILTRANRSGLTFYVNRRWIRSTALSYAVTTGYHGMLMHGRFPVAVLFLDLDPARIDVNVHPTKQEIRISKEAEVVELLKRVVKETLVGSRDLAPPLALISKEGGRRVYELRENASAVTEAPAGPPAQETFRPFSDLPVPAAVAVPLSEPVVFSDSLRVTKILGQLHQTFIVAETQEGFLILDQHAAHERILFETLLSHVRAGQAEKQTLLLDEVLELHPKQVDLFKRAVPFLERAGFDIEEFGERTYVIRAYPAVFGEMNPVGVLTTFLEELEDGKVRTVLEGQAEAVAALCACKKGAVKARDPLTPEAMRSLIKRLAACENPFTCPHGRPVFFTQTTQELERQFKR
ncbi:MAG: DNA mismatch repair endonuclease MutL [Candidatus Omnitrophica bacterium]|nr:DNA mismatch repair endonuclease MutL [Candidatus Omnitrophota bacterium]